MKLNLEIITDETKETRTIWRFTYFTGYGRTGATLDAYFEMVKPGGRRKWAVVKSWSRIDNRGHSMKNPPDVPEIVKILALQEYAKSLKFLD
ncbi:hypothetical protein HUU40_00250 [candidate division KSB1 bacterium]|nr:hypothetical protein [candidate division KSB1 bacterium]